MWDAHLGVLKTTEKTPLLLISPLGTNWVAMTGRSAICISHLGFGLETLHLRFNDLSGELSAELVSLSNLPALSLDENLLSGRVPSSLSAG